jgi:PAS domain S-box-containing protein
LGLVENEARATILKAAQERGSVRDVEIQVHTRSNQILDVLVSLEQIVLNGQVCMLTIQHDITERKRAEAEVRRLNLELENHRKDMQSVLDTMVTLNAKVALDGRLLFVNKIALQASGLPVDELMNTNFLEGPWWTFDPNVQARVKEAFARACSGTTINYDEKIFVFGRVLTINFSLTPMVGNDGGVEYILAEGRDITELKKLNELLEQRRIALESTNQELEAFSYSVSHDLRAPLRAINGFSQALSGKYKDFLGEQGQHFLNRIQQNATQMGQLIDDLLSLSRISRREMKQDVVNLTELAREVDRELRAQEPERQVLFEVDGKLQANGDAGLIRIVLQNLLTNAWKFTSTRPQAHIRLGARDGGFFVQDNGVGFDMAFANKLFGAFQRLHSTSEFPGTGIGLATVQRVIHRHGGKIWAEAELEKGATFHFTLGDTYEG